jgi:hypothetical protein
VLYLCKGWRVLTAGDEPDILALVKFYRLRFKNHPENRSAETIDESMRWPLRQRKKQLSDDYTYSHFNMPYDEFLAFGKAKLPEESFKNAVRDVAAIRLKANLIVAGFIDGSPEIYWTDEDGSAHPLNDFAVIGEGQYLAQSTLMRREQESRTTLHETLYNVFEAKKYSEAVGSVGTSTFLGILSADGKRELTSYSVDRQLREWYNEYGPRDLPGSFSLKGPVYYSEEKALEESAELAFETTRDGNADGSADSATPGQGAIPSDDDVAESSEENLIAE